MVPDAPSWTKTEVPMPICRPMEHIIQPKNKVPKE